MPVRVFVRCICFVLGGRAQRMNAFHTCCIWLTVCLIQCGVSSGHIRTEMGGMMGLQFVSGAQVDVWLELLGFVCESALDRAGGIEVHVALLHCEGDLYRWNPRF